MLQRADPVDVDFVVPFVAVMFQGMLFEEVLLDGGTGVNILLEEVYRRVKLGETLFLAPFYVEMADQRRFQPLGILKHQAIEVAGMVFFVNFVVLRMKDSDSCYKMLLERPWFRQARVKQDWRENVVMLRKGKNLVSISMQERKQIPPKIKPLCAQTINLADAVEMMKRRKFLELIPLLFLSLREAASLEEGGLASTAGVEGRPEARLGKQPTDLQHYPPKGASASGSREVLYPVEGTMQVGSSGLRTASVPAASRLHSYHIPVPRQHQQGSMMHLNSNNQNNMMSMMNMSNINTSTPCAACKLLRRRCAPECPFAPYFSPHEPQRFASVHKIYGASNVSKMLLVDEGKLAKMLAKDLTQEERQAYLAMLEGYPKLFINGYDQITGVSMVQHHINLKDGAKPVVQRLQRLGVIQQDALLSEVRKLLNAGFIYPVEDSEWVFRVVVTPKKNGKWRVCVDYKPLNATTKWDHFPQPFQDEILNEVAGYERYTVCDGYSWYFQIRIAEEDQKKTTFVTPWGCFAYRVMPFGLTNAPATFQRFVTHVFQPFFGKSIRVFIDDFCIYSSRDLHLEKVNEGLASEGRNAEPSGGGLFTSLPILLNGNGTYESAKMIGATT
ncbi:hypothetical protein L7F22_065154 [Adiantum nelumboides]|nr:hypothetical protein [Adiantum nelumboides]